MSFKIPRFWIFNQPKDVYMKHSDPPAVHSHLPKEKRPQTPMPAKRNTLIKSSSYDSPLEVVKPVVKAIETDVPIPYYAVSLPSNLIEDRSKPLVFVNKIDALKVMKKYEGSRFKMFRNEKDALEFATLSVEVTCGTPKTDLIYSPPVLDQDKNNNSAKSTQFKAPKSQATVVLRKAIVAGEVESFKATVWSNPRFLISFGDTPVILQEGFRYNALHVAAKHKQPELCRLILDTLGDPLFMELLYPDDSEIIRQQRISYITDLYLNMPDKRLCETPLHFASKFGCVETVRALASHPLCDKSRQNKYGLKAYEIICERCPSSCLKMKNQIEEAFEEQFFVPVFRSTDNSTQPSIGKPCYKENIDPSQIAESGSPRNASLSVMAVAGPMSPERASMFYKHLKTPVRGSRIEFKELNHIRLCDTEKGLERIGRDLAHNMKTQWTEYWPSLNAWCDLSSDEGLQTLENHLRQMNHQLLVQVSDAFDDDNCTSEEKITPDINCTSTSMKSKSSSSGISGLCSRFENCHLDDRSFSSSKSAEAHSLLNLNSGNRCQDFVAHDDSNEIVADIVTDRNCDNDRDVASKDIKYLLSKSNLEKFELCSQKITPRSKIRRFQGQLSARKQLENIFESPDCVSETYDDLFLPIEEKTAKQLFATNTHPQFFHNLKSLILSISDTLMSIATNLDFNDIDQIHEFAEDLVPEIKCLFMSSGHIKGDKSIIHSFIALQVYKELCNSFVEYENNRAPRLVKSYLNHYFYENAVVEDHVVFKNDLMWQHLKCILVRYCSLSTDVESKVSPCCCSWTDKTDPRSKFGPWGDDSHYGLVNSQWRNSHDEDDDEFHTPPTSPRVDFDSSEDEAVTPSEGVEVYVDGEYPSKADLDILRAIENIAVDPVKFPRIYQWKHLILSKDKKTVESWPSPSPIQIRWRTKTPRSLTCSPLSPLAITSTPAVRNKKDILSFNERLRQEEKLNDN